MRGLAQGHIADNLERETFKSCDFGGMVRQQLYTTEAQVMKYLGADSVIAIHCHNPFPGSPHACEIDFSCITA